MKPHDIKPEAASPSPPSLDRYHRQALLPRVGAAGQERLARGRALLVGCGALGTAIADQLARAGVGFLRIVDRDIVELTNLQRQTLYDESDAAAGVPKAVAAARRLGEVNSSICVEPVVADVHSGNIHDLLAGGIDLILDGSDNVQTRYLINDLAIAEGISWVYGAAVGTEGRVMAIRPGRSPCLRCIFPSPPRALDLPTCDIAGVLGPGATIVGAAQAIEGLRLLLGDAVEPVMLAMEFWPWRLRQISTRDARRDDCTCCAGRQFEFLEAPPADSAVSLCGRNAVQVRPASPALLALDDLAARLQNAGKVERTPFLLRCQLRDPAGVCLTLFPDGRALILGVTDLGRARSIYSRFVGG